MELEKAALITSWSLLAIGGIGIGYSIGRLYQAINEFRGNMTTFLDHYIIYASQRIRTPEEEQAIIELGQTRARVGI